MAEPVLLKDLACWLGGYDFSGYLNSVNFAAAKAELPNGRFGDSGEVFFHGLQQVTGEIGGFFSSESALAPDPVAWARIDPSLTPAAWPLVVIPPYSPGATPNTFGNWGYLVHGRQFNYNFGAPHGQLLPFNIGSRLSSGHHLYRQKLMLPKAAVSVTTTGTGFQLGALAVTEKLVASFHVFLISGTGSWTLTIQSDDAADFVGATTRATFTVVDQDDDPTTEVIEVAGAVTDSWWRALLTETSGTSTITAAVTLGIQNN